MKKVMLFLLLSSVAILLSSPLFSADIEIAAVVEKNSLSIGESFIYQIQINGSDSASGYPKDNWADTNFTNNFDVEFLGGQNNSSRQVSIINGRRKEFINTAYIISWSLTPLKSGILTIPPVSLTIEDNKYTTRPIKIESKEAEENENLKLLVSLDKDRAYVGEPLIITYTWYIGVNIKDFLYSVPFFQDKNFSFHDHTGLDPDTSSLIRFPIDGTSVTALQGKGTLKGSTYTTVTFSKLIIPKKAGNYNIPKSVISVSAEISNRGRANDLFSSFFSSFSNEYKYFTVPSNDLSLKVLALPSVGKPDNFNGYIGELNIKTSAVPLSVRVGDPITFTMRISGPKNIAEWNPPDLNKQYELAANFKMPSEISAGKIEGNSVVFTQTIRSLNDTITKIPAIEIPYFDTVKGEYSFARSEAIPITVEKGSAVKVEGSVSPNSGDMQQEIVRASNYGINFNYNDIKILKNQSYGLKIFGQFPFNLLIIVPPLFFFGFFIYMITKDRKYFTTKNIRKNSLREITKELKTIKSELETSSEDIGRKIKIIFLNFMANKISGTSGSITEKDINIWFVNNNVEVGKFPLIFEVLSLLDEIQYAGSLLKGKEREIKIVNLIDKVLLAVEDIEGRSLK